MTPMRRPMAMLATALLAACATPRTDGRPTATADIRDAQGEVVATATLVQDGERVELTVTATALPPGAHGIHLHEVGTCAAPDFTSAGGHFNPTSRRHGFDNPEGPHAGDLRNIEIAAGGGGRYVEANDRITLTDGPRSVMDGNGTAIVVHAGPDDYRTDPTGDSGSRIACGVIARI
jgi:Cu-Zn family superoxide dismutase